MGELEFFKVLSRKTMPTRREYLVAEEAALRAEKERADEELRQITEQNNKLKEAIKEKEAQKLQLLQKQNHQK